MQLFKIFRKHILQLMGTLFLLLVRLFIGSLNMHNSLLKFIKKLPFRDL